MAALATLIVFASRVEIRGYRRGGFGLDVRQLFLLCASNSLFEGEGSPGIITIMVLAIACRVLII